MDPCDFLFVSLSQEHRWEGDRAPLTCIDDLNQAAAELGAVNFGGGADVLNGHLTAMPGHADFRLVEGRDGDFDIRGCRDTDIRCSAGLDVFIRGGLQGVPAAPEGQNGDWFQSRCISDGGHTENVYTDLLNSG